MRRHAGGGFGLCADAPRVMIIGGGEIYRIFEAQAVRIHLTRVHAKPSGDTHFALADPDAWQETRRYFAPPVKKIAPITVS